MWEVSRELHSGDQRFVSRVNNAVLTEIFRRFSCYLVILLSMKTIYYNDITLIYDAYYT